MSHHRSRGQRHELAQATIETIVALIAGLTLFYGSLKVWTWLDDVLVNRQEQYQRTRRKAASSQPGMQNPYQQPFLSIFNEASGFVIPFAGGVGPRPTCPDASALLAQVDSLLAQAAGLTQQATALSAEGEALANEAEELRNQSEAIEEQYPDWRYEANLILKKEIRDLKRQRRQAKHQGDQAEVARLNELIEDTTHERNAVRWEIPEFKIHILEVQLEYLQREYSKESWFGSAKKARQLLKDMREKEAEIRRIKQEKRDFIAAHPETIPALKSEIRQLKGRLMAAVLRRDAAAVRRLTEELADTKAELAARRDVVRPAARKILNLHAEATLKEKQATEKGKAAQPLYQEASRLNQEAVMLAHQARLICSGHQPGSGGSTGP